MELDRTVRSDGEAAMAGLKSQPECSGAPGAGDMVIMGEKRFPLTQKCASTKRTRPDGEVAGM